MGIGKSGTCGFVSDLYVQCLDGGIGYVFAVAGSTLVLHPKNDFGVARRGYRRADSLSDKTAP